MTIKLIDAAHYYEGKPGQKAAFQYLQNELTGEQLGIFASQYRNNPPVNKPRPPAKNIQEFLRIIKNRLDTLDIKLYTGGSKGYGYTIIGVEGVDNRLVAHADEMDKWNDFVFALKAYPDGRLDIVGGFVCTTEPGRYYTKVKHLNKRGAAYVKLDTKHNGVWQLGWHNDQRDCLVQTGAPITVIRDQNSDGKRGPNEYEGTGWYGINFHHTKGNYNPQSIGRWSAGCCVIPNPQQHKVIVDGFKASGQTKCSYVLLDGKKLS